MRSAIFVACCLLIASYSIASETEESLRVQEDGRLLILPSLIAKPLVAVGMMATLKPIMTAIGSLPKPGLQLEIIKHEGPSIPPSTPAPPTPPTPSTPSPLVTIPPTFPHPDCGKLEGFPCYRLPSGCFCPVSTQMSWSDAFKFCQARGKSLISFETAAKQAEMQTYLPIITGSNNIFANIGLWTSGVYSGVASVFMWASYPVFFTFTNWAAGEPNAKTLANGACVRAVPTLTYQWDDIGCEQLLPFICESPVLF